MDGNNNIPPKTVSEIPTVIGDSPVGSVSFVPATSPQTTNLPVEATPSPILNENTPDGNITPVKTARVPETPVKPARAERPAPIQIPAADSLAPKTPDQTVFKGSLRNIRTYQTDVSESVRSNKTSLVHMVIAEQERKKELAQIESPASRKNIIFISISLILLLSGTITAIVFFNKSRQVENTPTVVRDQAFIFAENSKNFSVTGVSTDLLAKTIADEVEKANNKLDTVENLTFSEKVGNTDVSITTQRLFFFLDNRMPPALLRSIDKNFMLGIHTFNGNHPFLIFKTNFYENAFAGMLGWEQYMARDLFPIFSINKNPSSSVFERNFEDKTIKNLDARVLRDDNGNILLFYTFKDKQTLIVTNSEDTLGEMVSRLNSSGSSIR